jgi:hypothetical protein
MESDQFKGEGLSPIVGWILEGDGQIDLPERYGLLPRHDVVERRSSRSNARSVDTHGIKRLWRT